MLHHVSIAVKNPAHVSRVLAEIFQGKAFPFPVFPNSYIVLAGDEHGTALEITPMGTELIPGIEEVVSQENPSPSGFTATHIAISVPVSREEIEEIAAREGWMTLYCDRGSFDLVELWVENHLLLELLTPEMSARYTEFLTVPNYEAFLSAIAA
jgi:hypothetical protein